MSEHRESMAGGGVSRRGVLRAGGVAVGALLAGCSFQPFDEEAPVPRGRLFVENRTNFPKLIALAVIDGPPDGDALVRETYRIPEWHALQFGDVLEAGRTYEVRAFQPEARGRGQERLGIDIETCAADDPSAQMDVTILASSNGPDILTYACDETYAKTQSLTYVDPADYVVQDATVTIPSPTPG